LWAADEMAGFVAVISHSSAERGVDPRSGTPHGNRS
jgi:hypothetical protein